MKSLLLLAMTALFFSCQEHPAKETAAAQPDSKDTTAPGPKKLDLTRGKGSLSFKLNGQLYATDPTKTKCWTTTQGNGIYNMQQRAAARNDLLEIKSEPGKGTVVMLEMHTT